MTFIRPAQLRLIPCLTLAAMLLPLAGCGDSESLSRSIGLTRDAPDEFTVTTRAPLSMPPDYTLHPPKPGSTRPQERSSSAAAEAVLNPQSVLAAKPSANLTAGEQALLEASGPTAPAGIRDDVNKLSTIDSQTTSITDRLMFWKSTPDAGVVVDPAREAKRLHENAALGQSVQAGDTPIIQRKGSPLLNGLLGDIF